MSNKRTKALGFLLIVTLVMLGTVGLFSVFSRSSVVFENPVVLLEVVLYGSGELKLFLLLSFTVSLVLSMVFVVAYFRGRLEKDLFGSARWATNSDLPKYREVGINTEGRGIYLGFVRQWFSKTFLYFDIEVQAGHPLLAAPTASGKSAAYSIPILLTYNGSMIVNDNKNELFVKTAGFRKAKGQAVFKFEPFSESGETCFFNPLAMIENRNPNQITQLHEIAEVFWPTGLAEGKSDIWNPAAKDLFVTIALLLFASEEDTGVPVSIPAINDFVLASSDVVDYIEKYAVLYWDELDPACKQGINDLRQSNANDAGKEISGVLKTFKTQLLPFRNPLVAAAFSDNSFNFSDLKSTPTTIYFCIPPQYQELGRVLTLLFWNTAMSRFMTTGIINDTQKYTVCLMDEVARSGFIPLLSSGISDIRGYGMILFNIIQSKSQLIKHYKEAGTDTIIGNSSLRIFYAPNELNTAQFVSDTLGKQTITQKTVSISGRSRNVSKSLTKQELMDSSEVQRLDKQKAILFVEGMNPIKIHKGFYFKIPQLLARVMSPPNVLSYDVDSYMKAYRAKDIVLDGIDDDAGFTEDDYQQAMNSDHNN